MSVSLIDAESLLSIDLGTMHTRASLFDVVEGRYHFIALGSALSTVNAPYSDAREGVYLAIRSLQEICGRKLLTNENTIIIPSQNDGSGVDRLILTHSCGPEIRMVLAGLLEEVSLESAHRLAASLPGRVLDTISLNENRSRAMQLDAVLAAHPDLMIISGGTEGGASRSVYDLIELVALTCQILPQEERPSVFYCGNRMLAKNIKEFLEKMTHVRVSPNLRPTIEKENLGPAQDILGNTVTEIRLRQIGGLQDLTRMCTSYPMPTSFAFGRMVRFLSQLYDPVRGVMGIDLGSNGLTVASAISGDLSLRVFPYGMGTRISGLIENSKLEDITRWLSIDIPESELQDILWQMSLYPHRIPATSGMLAVQQAVARQALRLAMKKIQALFPQMVLNFEPFLVSGATLAHAPSPMSSLLMLLDGIQPVGVTTMVLDQNNLVASLGAAAEINTLLPVQVLESGAFLHLGTIISPVSQARSGAEILRVRMEYENGETSRFEVKKGSLITLPLQAGQSARIHLEALRRTVIEPLSGARTGSYRIVGGACGAVIDARGRPLVLPQDGEKRRDLLRKWSSTLGL